jgi:hypothetical protein
MMINDDSPVDTLVTRLVPEVRDGETAEVLWHAVFSGSGLSREMTVGWVRHDFPMKHMWSEEAQKWVDAPEGTITSWWGMLCDCPNREECSHGDCIARQAADTLRDAELHVMLTEAFKEKITVWSATPWSYDVKIAADTVELLHAWSQDNVYVGNRNGDSLYVQQAARVLDWVSPEFWWKVNDELEQRKTLTLNGMIYVPWYDREPVYKEREKATGHRMFDSGDWGNWYCHACGADGDAQDNPKNIICNSVKVQQMRAAEAAEL